MHCPTLLQPSFPVSPVRFAPQARQTAAAASLPHPRSDASALSAATRRAHTAGNAARCCASASQTQATLQVDVCVLGGGIIGLTTALALLCKGAAVALVEKEAAICTGSATGAGQGYLWLAHRDPSSPLWQLAVNSKQMWLELLHSSGIAELTPAAVEWQAAGSMLLASNTAESEALRQRLGLLLQAGIQAQHLTAAAAQHLEPALRLGGEGSALLVPSDVQVNGRAAAAALLQACKAFGSRFSTLFGQAASGLVIGPSGRCEGVTTPAHSIGASQGVVVALGAWSGIFLAKQLGDERWAATFRPRRGLLLEMPRPAGMPALGTAMMEVGYTKHYSGSSTGACLGGDVDVTFTATTSAAGTLLVGSSREFAGFDSVVAEPVVASILDRAAQFLPGLAAAPLQHMSVRCGPRPFCTAGHPFVGAVPEAPGLYVAAGHEGSGLTLAPATAAVVCDAVLGAAASSQLADSLRVHLG